MLNRTFGCVCVVRNRTLAWRHQRYHGEQARTGFTQASAFSATSGLAPSAYQRQLRLRAARRLLGLGVPAAEAAILVGFADQAHLTRRFRRVYGVTPRCLQPGRPLTGSQFLPGVAGSLPGVAGSLPGVAGSLPGVAGSLPGVAGSLPGVAGSLPGVAGPASARLPSAPSVRDP